MRTSTEGILAAVILAVIIGLFYNSPDASAEEGSIIKIEAGGDKTPQAIAIRPQTLTVEKDTVVIWLNAVRDDELNILFDDGEQTKAATGNPSGFDLTKNGIYAAKYLPFIATASLRFVKPGTYSYRVISQKNKFEMIGTITVP